MHRSSIIPALLLVALFPAFAALAQELPAFENAPPAAGHFVKVTAPEYQGTGVYHGLYLPVDWKKGRAYPVIVEYAGNSFGDICTGKVEDCKLGFYARGGKGLIW